LKELALVTESFVDETDIYKEEKKFKAEIMSTICKKGIRKLNIICLQGIWD
jgi:hypothetical protein